MSRVDDVERLLQVLQVLRNAEGWPVPRPALISKVSAYASSTADNRSLKKMIQRDVKDLVGLGFRVEEVADPGEDSRLVLHAGTWRVPVELDDAEQALLVWVTAVAGAAVAEDSAGSADLSDLLGRVPRELDLVQSAIARRLRIRVERDGDEVEFEPAELASRLGRWFVLGRYAGSTKVLAPRLDGLVVLGLGGPVPGPFEVGDVDERLDPTAWDEHPPVDVVLSCRTSDLSSVRSWFERASLEHREDGTSVLRFWATNEAAVVTRVIGLAGAVQVLAPDSVAAEIRQRAEAVLVGA
ncbi:MAG: WYL domain-containing protein [Mycobacteriales bacterium]|nr:WYL domain-containing protein [Mycobacteriales bacterium]